MLFLNFLFLTIVVYFGFLHNPVPIEFFNEPFPTTKEIYRPGEPVRIHAEYCRYVDVPMERFMEFRNSVIVPVPPVSRPGQDPICEEKYIIIATIPEHFPTSETEDVHIYARSTYWVNPIGKREVIWQTQPFKVIDGETDAKPLPD